MNVIVVGAGGTSRELLRRLGALWDITLVDRDESAFPAARDIREFEEVVGDGSSALVLRRAGLDTADALIAATDDDDVNLEAAKLAKDAGLLRVAAVVATPERLQDYRDLDISIASPDTDAARHLEVELEPRRISSTEFAQGKAEAIEFEIAPDSMVRDKALRDLHSETFVIAAVLRDGELIVPHGETRLRAGDRVTVVGRASGFSTIVKTFTSGESRFPLNFGKKVAVALDSPSDLDGVVSEAVNFVKSSQATGLLVVHRDLENERDETKAQELEDLILKLEAGADGIDVTSFETVADPAAGLRAAAADESVGVVVAPGPSGGGMAARLRVRSLVNGYGALGLPLLVSRLSHPYSSVLVPARRTPAGEAAGRAGIDIARTSGVPLIGLAVVPPSFVGDESDVDSAKRASAWLRQEASVQGVHPKRLIRQGNIVRVIEETASASSLIVLGMPDLPMSGIWPGVTGHTIRRVKASILLVPPTS